MNIRFLSHSLLVVAACSSVACGSGSDGSSASGGNGSGGGNGQGASAQHGGGADASGGTPAGHGGRPNGGSAQSDGGSRNSAGSQNTSGHDAGGGDAGGSDVGGTNAGGSDSGGVGGLMGMGGGTSAPAPDTFPLLVATSSNKVQVWEHADALETNDPPSFALNIPLGANDVILGAVATRERLGIVASSGLFLFDDLGKLGPDSTASVTIAAKALSGGIKSNFQQQVIDDSGDLWLTYGEGRIALFRGFNALTAASKPQAEFTHPWGQIASAAYYPRADILFAPQVSGAGLLYYSKAKTKTGIVPTPDAAFDEFTGWQSAVVGNSLFAAAESLGVWHGLDAAVTPRAPSAKIVSAGFYVDAAADAVVTADSDGIVSYFGSADSLTSGSKPQTIAVKAAIYGLDLSRDARTLATAASTEISVITHGASGLELQATLPLGAGVGQGNDVTFVE